MKVKELIEKLQAMPPEAEVEIAYTEHDNAFMTSTGREESVEEVRQDPNYPNWVYICDNSRKGK